MREDRFAAFPRGLNPKVREHRKTDEEKVDRRKGAKGQPWVSALGAVNDMALRGRMGLAVSGR